MLSEGNTAPDFSLRGSDGKTHTLRDFSGRLLVLYFYPKDETPGCTMEAKSLSENLQEIRAAGATVAGISADSVDSHCRFAGKHGLEFLLLSDPGMETIKAYESYGNRGIFGPGTLRNTFVIGKDGRILKIIRKVKPAHHGAEILEIVEALSGK